MKRHLGSRYCLKQVMSEIPQPADATLLRRLRSDDIKELTGTITTYNNGILGYQIVHNWQMIPLSNIAMMVYYHRVYEHLNIT